MEKRRDPACTKKWQNSQLVDCGHYTEEKDEEECNNKMIIIQIVLNHRRNHRHSTENHRPALRTTPHRNSPGATILDERLENALKSQGSKPDSYFAVA
jgi:hypothetical protein